MKPGDKLKGNYNRIGGKYRCPFCACEETTTRDNIYRYSCGYSGSSIDRNGFSVVTTPCERYIEMKNISVKVSPEESDVLQRLAFLKGYSWQCAGKQVGYLSIQIIFFNKDGTIYSGVGRVSDYEELSFRDALTFLATAQLSMKLGEYTVVYNADLSGIKVGCTAVSKAQVDEIHAKLHSKD